jgi:hypothetical protein
VTLADSTCRLLVCDFDGGTWRLDAAAYAEAAGWAGVPAAIEISRSVLRSCSHRWWAPRYGCTDLRWPRNPLLRGSSRPS